ncbi:MAG: DUF1285 domain-containing protein [Ferrovibrionaceae bacterium]
MTSTASGLPQPGFDLGRLFAELKDRRLPPVEKWEPPFCGDIDMRIARDGSWFYLGTPIGRREMVRLFSTVLRRDADGRYYLVTPVEKCGITVDDAPFVAVELLVEGQGPEQRLSFRTNVDDVVSAGPDHPLRVEVDPVTGAPAPYVHLRGRLEARVNRPVFYELVGLAEPDPDDPDGIGVWSGGTFFPLGSTVA